MHIDIELEDPRLCWCPCRKFCDGKSWCGLGYWKCSEMGNGVLDTKTDKIVARDIDLNNETTYRDEWFGLESDGRPNRHEWVFIRPQECIDKHGE